MSYVNLKITGSESRLSFKVRDGDRGRPWWYYLDIDGEPLYLISSVCGTCETILRRSTSVTKPLTPEQLSSELNKGLTHLSQTVIDTLTNILPDGEYFVNLIQVKPKISTQFIKAQKNNPPPQYWWRQEKSVNQGRTIRESLLPVISEKLLNRDRIEAYKTLLKSGEKPTALALSLVDVRYPLGSFLDWQLLHFLLDGHHKLMAASELKMPINILSFLLKDQSSASTEYFDETLKWRYE